MDDTRIAWITGSSSGIGRACVSGAPPGTRVVSIARRAQGPDGLRLDLATPAAWDAVLSDVRERLATRVGADSVFIHLAGALGDLGKVVDLDVGQYRSSFLLNAVSTLVLGQGYLAACREAGVAGTFVVSSSPAAAAVLPGMSQYCSAKAAVAKWVEVVAAELEDMQGLRVLGVVPHAVDTPMVRDVMGEGRVALASYFEELAEGGDLASPESAAAHLWEAVLDPSAGPLVPIGARWLATPDSA